MEILNSEEYAYLVEKLKRKPNDLEQYIISAQWSEHCSYKSSKKYLKQLPTGGEKVIVGPGFDAGVIDVGGGYIITVHIESHNHPSAVEPYGGAATGVGGVLRDILSMGTRPIAVLDALRFGNIDNHEISSGLKNQWLLKNVVKGIADYGNCIGIPTIGGEIEFDDSFENYCLVDVASIGHGKIGDLVKNKVKNGDIIILAGNSTGKDGIHGASFASKNLEEENRSAVQIPDPFLEKILLEATMEAIQKNCIKAMKDLGGGGLSCCLSETADNLRKGFEIELSNVHLRQSDITNTEIMISESQERMLFITSKKKKKKLFKILEKYNIRYSVIGKVNNKKNLLIKKEGLAIANMPAELIAHAPLLDRTYKRPQYLEEIQKLFDEPKKPKNILQIIYKMISNPSISSKKWIYRQYDYEVGIRTVLKPGMSDSPVLKLDNGKFITFKLDGNSKHCYLDPYKGTMGLLSESVRNTICVGAEPIGIVDHLQFGNPENEEVFWTFVESLKAIKDFCEFMHIPIVGGKVSLYNETSNGPIKPSPVIGTLGLIEKKSQIKSPVYEHEEQLFIIGTTFDELGGSEYYEYFHKIRGGVVPEVNLLDQKKILESVQLLMRNDLITAIHDCSKGGLIICLLEMAIQSQSGFVINVEKIPTSCKRLDYLLFSETHNRYIFSSKNPEKIVELLTNADIPFANIGITTNDKTCILQVNDKETVNIPLLEVSDKYMNSISNILKGKN